MMSQNDHFGNPLKTGFYFKLGSLEEICYIDMEKSEIILPAFYLHVKSPEDALSKRKIPLEDYFYSSSLAPVDDVLKHMEILGGECLKYSIPLKFMRDLKGNKPNLSEQTELDSGKKDIEKRNRFFGYFGFPRSYRFAH